MGLDMYLKGDRYEPFVADKEPVLVDGFPRKTQILELGYWRKHPDLHGFIVRNFAEDGEDDCEAIELGIEDLTTIIRAIESDALDHDTQGFFFGASPQPNSEDPEEREYYEKQKAQDILVFTRARTWLENKVKGLWKSVEYEASW